MISNIANILFDYEKNYDLCRLELYNRADFNRMIYKQLIYTQLSKKALRVFFCASFCFSFGISQTSFAQTIVNSPLSYIGMGEIYPAETPSNSMMGGIGISNSNGIYSNQMNPALLARNRYTVLEAGINAE
jgi:hypothetical protein